MFGIWPLDLASVKKASSTWGASELSELFKFSELVSLMKRITCELLCFSKLWVKRMLVMLSVIAQVSVHFLRLYWRINKNKKKFICWRIAQCPQSFGGSVHLLSTVRSHTANTASCIFSFLTRSVQAPPAASVLCYRCCCGCSLVATVTIFQGSFIWAHNLRPVREVWDLWFSFSGGAEMSNCAKAQIQHATVELNPESFLKICAFGLHSA